MPYLKFRDKLLRLRNRHFFIIDVIFLLCAPFLALLIRLDGEVDLAVYQAPLINITIIFLIIKITLFVELGLYKRYWANAGIDEVARLIIISAYAVILQTVIFLILKYFNVLSIQILPKSLPIIDGFLSLIFIGNTRLSIRLLERVNERKSSRQHAERVLIIGAGNAGVSIAEEMQRNQLLNSNPVGFIDDDPQKKNYRIRGIPVIGDRTKIREAVKELNVKKVVIAMPEASGEDIRSITNICLALGVQTRTMPAISELLTDRAKVSYIREVQIEDLLRRKPVETDIESVAKFIESKTVLITGAGGSIGGELCRQILKCNPARLLLMGHGENSVFEIEQELNEILDSFFNYNSADIKIIPVICDIRFKPRVDLIFDEYKPDVIFHAAAHKHVPMMESNPAEAVSNNIRGTRNLVESAVKHNIEHFVLVSTDKAVNPTSIMGACKRIAEMIVYKAARETGNHYVAVRFGNVLGSRGSAILTFKRQIANGGPITITHPDIKRYFMTIPEAVQLVLQASVLGKGGEIFVLDMGEPIKVLDLVEDMIKLSGYRVDKDIKVIFTGLRPGEKLYEELFIKGEEYGETSHEKILITKHQENILVDGFDKKIELLLTYFSNKDKEKIISILRELVPEYAPIVHANASAV